MKNGFLTSVMLLLLCLPVYGQKYDRGYETVPAISFVTKGGFMIGGSGRFSYHNMKDYSFLVANGINSHGYTISADPTILFIIKDNLGVGATFSYGRTLLDMDSANISVSDITMSVNDYYRLSQTISGALVMRPYIPLGRSGRFSIFVQVELGYSNTRMKNTVEQSSDIKGTFSTRNRIHIGINPGITAFLTNHFAMELGVGILGVSYSWVSQVHNQVEHGSASFSNASFMLNLASINVGLAYYL